jgi:hypothetical protein
LAFNPPMVNGGKSPSFAAMIKRRHLNPDQALDLGV